MRSEREFLHHFKVAAPQAVSTFGPKIGHLALKMILHSSSKKVGLVAHHYRHFVRATVEGTLSLLGTSYQSILLFEEWKIETDMSIIVKSHVVQPLTI